MGRRNTREHSSGGKKSPKGKTKREPSPVQEIPQRDLPLKKRKRADLSQGISVNTGGMIENHSPSDRLSTFPKGEDSGRRTSRDSVFRAEESDVEGESSSSAQSQPVQKTLASIYAALDDEASEGSIYRQYQSDREGDEIGELTDEEKLAYDTKLVVLSEAATDKGIQAYRQGAPRDGRERMPTHKELGNQERVTSRMRADFFRFNSSKGGRTQARISLRVKPEKAVAVMTHIVEHHLVSRISNVTTGKLAGSGAIHSRTDSIVLTLSTTDQNIVQGIADDIVRNNQDAMMSGVPWGMRSLRPGIGFAQRHPIFSSHGSKLSEMMSTGKYQKLSIEEAQAKYGIDPNQPWANMPVFEEWARKLKKAINDLGNDPDERYDIENIAAHLLKTNQEKLVNDSERLEILKKIIIKYGSYD